MDFGQPFLYLASLINANMVKSSESAGIVELMQSFSIDVVLGALAMGMFAVKWCNASLPGVWWVVLALAVWIIYTADHLVDGMKRKEEATIFRHRLHYRFRLPIAVLIVFLAAVTLVLSIYFLPRDVLEGGFLLSAFVLLYLLFIALFHFREKYFLKEFFIALIYVLGIWLGPLTEGGGFPAAGTVMLTLGFVLLVFSEGVLVSLYELTFDRHDRQPSFTTFFGEQRAETTVKILLIVVFSNAVLWAFISGKRLYAKGFVIEALMALLLFFMLRVKVPFRKKRRFRLAGELVFWLPALLWWI